MSETNATSECCCTCQRWHRERRCDPRRGKVKHENRGPAVLTSDAFYARGDEKTKDMTIPVVFGKRPNGEIVIRDLARMPHLLIAGKTGAGKSVFLHSLICCLVLNDSPEDIQLVLIDPKCVEFAPYAQLPHLYASIVNDLGQAVAVLERIETEVHRRLSVFAEKGCRSIADFNTLSDVKKMPRLIAVADEIADYMVGTDGGFEAVVNRIAAMGREAGVHLVLATSRPGGEVLSGGLKTNIPGRLAFRVCRAVDSLSLPDDEEGAADLVGRGDALLKDASGLIARLQVPYIRAEAIARLADSAVAWYPGRKVSVVIPREKGDGREEASYVRAVELIRRTGCASLGRLQRELEIGYAAAARLMTRLEVRGIVGPAQKNGRREIRMV